MHASTVGQRDACTAMWSILDCQPWCEWKDAAPMSPLRPVRRIDPAAAAAFKNTLACCLSFVGACPRMALELHSSGAAWTVMAYPCPPSGSSLLFQTSTLKSPSQIYRPDRLNSIVCSNSSSIRWAYSPSVWFFPTVGAYTFATYTGLAEPKSCPSHLSHTIPP
jgi:hypothetical protein